ncbi:MAG: DUF2163 domain-containing protein [Hyphomicrobiales bacterium]|nr:DUF2163 domain-containing protein [Hyphomicrobiales bacterium]
MRQISSAFAAAFASPATTLCHCWRLTRRDGAVMGFTDHDCDLAFAGAIFSAATGLDAAQAESAAGLAVGSGDVQGALDSAGIDEVDIESGLYDDASVEIWLVDWTNVDNRVLLDVATIGEVKRTEFAFIAELRSIAHRFDEDRGRQFQRGCSADLGDAACKIDLSSALYSTGATILSQEKPGSYIVATDAGFSSDFFTNGSLARGADAAVAIKLHEKAVNGDRIVLWAAPAIVLAPGARVALRAGCDKSPESCRQKFDNLVNFRGFPHMPGNDAVVSYPGADGAPMDGGSLFR